MTAILIPKNNNFYIIEIYNYGKKDKYTRNPITKKRRVTMRVAAAATPEDNLLEEEGNVIDLIADITDENCVIINLIYDTFYEINNC